jgi:hypothetical protein
MAARTRFKFTRFFQFHTSKRGPAARIWLAWSLLAMGPPFLAAAVSRPAAAPSSPGPISDWVDDVGDDVDDDIAYLEDAEAVIGNNQGPLADPDKTQVAGDLSAALAIIERILDPNQYPSLDPPDAGEILTNFNPTTLPAYARDCADLAQDALDELRSAVIDHKVIGSDLKTIKHLITRSSPHNYRTKAGITGS